MLSFPLLKGAKQQQQQHVNVNKCEWESGVDRVEADKMMRFKFLEFFLN